MTDRPRLGFTDVHAAVIPTLTFKQSVHLNYSTTMLLKLTDFSVEGADPT
jgi:hypothetical protein